MLFLLGTDEKINNNTKHELIEERNIHGDIIQVDGLTEHYNNLTLKTLYTIKFFLQKGKRLINKVPLNKSSSNKIHIFFIGASMIYTMIS